jgi:hypothetical protein
MIIHVMPCTSVDNCQMITNISKESMTIHGTSSTSVDNWQKTTNISKMYIIYVMSRTLNFLTKLAKFRTRPVMDHRLTNRTQLMINRWYLPIWQIKLNPRSVNDTSWVGKLNSAHDQLLVRLLRVTNWTQPLDWSLVLLLGLTIRTRLNGWSLVLTKSNSAHRVRFPRPVIVTHRQSVYFTS